MNPIYCSLACLLWVRELSSSFIQTHCVDTWFSEKGSDADFKIQVSKYFFHCFFSFSKAFFSCFLVIFWKWVLLFEVECSFDPLVGLVGMNWSGAVNGSVVLHLSLWTCFIKFILMISIISFFLFEFFENVWRGLMLYLTLVKPRTFHYRKSEEEDSIWWNLVLLPIFIWELKSCFVSDFEIDKFT